MREKIPEGRRRGILPLTALAAAASLGSVSESRAQAVDRDAYTRAQITEMRRGEERGEQLTASQHIAVAGHATSSGEAEDHTDSHMGSGNPVHVSGTQAGGGHISVKVTQSYTKGPSPTKPGGPGASTRVGKIGN